MVEFDGYKGPFSNLHTRTVLVFLATTQFRHTIAITNHDCQRTQFSLVVAYAITIHKLQGMTLESREDGPKYSFKKDFRPGLMYVGIAII
jgi:hypothetical protein